MTFVRKFFAVLTAALLGLSILVLTAPSQAAPAAARVTGGDGSFAKTKVVTRESIDADGHVTVDDRRNVTLKVGQTVNLRGRQEVDVSWSGARPTGGLVGDLNSAAGVNEEYPFVLLQCRGVDSTSVPAAQRIRPETCWTQTSQERYTSTNNTYYPAWRSDAFAPTAERGAAVNAPAVGDRPALCSRPSRAERWVPMVSASGAKYLGGTLGCAGMAPESSNVGGTGLPSNSTYAITGRDGKGSAKFAAWTDDENSTLGCNASVKCALVAVPIMGISCDAYGTKLPAGQRPSADDGLAADSVCHAPDRFTPGEVASVGDAPNPASAGALWWSGSNWRNRFTVPLSFAQTSDVCDVVSNTAPIAFYGSVLLNELTAQWQPKFCTDKTLKPFVHVQTADPTARTLLDANNIEAAFTSRAPDDGFLKPTVQAPVAVTGFAISYVIDDANGKPYTKLRLTPRLLAKLLSESYPGNALIKNNYPALSDNPVNVTQDPEFQALNPGLPRYATQEAAATLLSLSSDADLVYGLTSYINADSDARKWLDGTPDPWGMKVNPEYKGMDLPVYSWPLLDDTLAPQSYIDSGNNPCYTHSPSPYLALIANPTGFISNIVLNMQYAISNVNVNCNSNDPHDISTLRMSIQGRQQPGFRFVLGLVPLSSVPRYSLDSAALQAGPDGTSSARAADGVAGLTSRAFVKGNDAGMRAASKLFKADKAAKVWSVDYDTLRSAKGSTAYPGTLPVFADIPTTSLDKKTAARLAQFLRFAAGAGQTAGLANGELPPGYLPLTKANGLAALANYTERAATAVAEQKAFVPSLDAADDPASSTTDPTNPDGEGDPGIGVLPNTPGDVGSPTPGSNGQKPVVTSLLVVTALETKGHHSAFGSYALPVLFGLGLALGLLGVALRWSETINTAAGPALRNLLVRIRR